MSNHQCRSIMYECTKLTPNNDIFSDEIRIVLENIVYLKKVPLMHLLIVILSGIAHWCSKTVLNIDVDWDIPLIFFGVIIGYPGSNKSTTIGLIERATREIEQYLQIKIEDSRINGSVTIESLLHELEKKGSTIQAFDEFNTFASSFNLYRSDKALYHRSVLNTLWNGPKCYFRQLVKGDIKCENPWLSIVAAGHPGAIVSFLKDENNQLGSDGLFARFIFSARISPEDVHKRTKHVLDIDIREHNSRLYPYPSLTHVMYFIHLMHHEQPLTLKLSQEANEILIRTHDEYNSMVIGFQGYQDVLCTLFSKSRDHLYRVCGLIHLLHQSCKYVLKAEPMLQYLIFNDDAAESIQKMAILAKENFDDYLTVSADTAKTAVELMRFYVGTKKLLYGFPLITIPPSQEKNIGPSVSEQILVTQRDTEPDESLSLDTNNINGSVVSSLTGFSSLSATDLNNPMTGSVIDACIKKILMYKRRTITSTHVAQILRRPGVNANNIKKIFTFMENSRMGTQLIEKQRRSGRPRLSFIKDDVPNDKELEKYHSMIDFLNRFDMTSEQYGRYLETTSESSIVLSTNTNSGNIEE